MADDIAIPSQTRDGLKSPDLHISQHPRCLIIPTLLPCVRFPEIFELGNPIGNPTTFQLGYPSHSCAVVLYKGKCAPLGSFGIWASPYALSWQPLITRNYHYNFLCAFCLIILTSNIRHQHVDDFYGFDVFGTLGWCICWARWWVQLKNSSFSTWAGRRILPANAKCAMRLFLVCFNEIRWWEKNLDPGFAGKFNGQMSRDVTNKRNYKGVEVLIRTTYLEEINIVTATYWRLLLSFTSDQEFRRLYCFRGHSIRENGTLY